MPFFDVRAMKGGARAVAAWMFQVEAKSGLRRAGWSLTATHFSKEG
jgi:hypothetical protein